MELEHQFQVGVSVERAWAVFTDLSRIVPNMPGASLDRSDGETWLGNIKVKVGPVTAQYKGKAWFLETDEAGRRVVLRAEGRETRGQGNAKATITLKLTAIESGTDVVVKTELSITGRVAQIGRGLIADISGRLLGQFAENLEGQLRDELASGAVGETGPAAAAPQGAPEAVPVDLLATAGAPFARRLLPLIAVAGLALLAFLWLTGGIR